MSNFKYLDVQCPTRVSYNCPTAGLQLSFNCRTTVLPKCPLIRLKCVRNSVYAWSALEVVSQMTSDQTETRPLCRRLRQHGPDQTHTIVQTISRSKCLL